MADPPLPPGQKWYEMADVAPHNKEGDCWVVVQGNVINVTHFLNIHPGGKAILLEKAGTDPTEMFETIHPPGTIEKHATDKILGKIKGWKPPEKKVEKDVRVWTRNEHGGGPIWAVKQVIRWICGQNKADAEYAKRLKATYGPREIRLEPKDPHWK